MADKLTLDKHDMKNPATANLRIYVGGLTDDATVDQIYNHFIEYGQIDGIIINRVFGFVQFREESSVQNAILKGNMSILQGRKITVRVAQRIAQPKRETELAVVQSELPTPVTLSDNIQGSSEPASEEPYDNYGNYVADRENYREEDYERSEPRGGLRERGRGRGRGRGAVSGFRERSPGRKGEWLERNYNRYPLPEYPRTLPLPERNDCEIIVLDKSLTEYAEYIEGRLKRLGIVVDLLFPMEDVPIGKVLGNIASRGCLYAILIMPLNLEHKSLTLTILHGLPQEHRNMPIEDALQLLSRNFQEVQRGGPSGREAVYALLGQLADGRSLTALQYDKVMEYLQERREQQVQLELGEPLTTNNNKTQVDLQQRILNILNDKKPASEPTPTPPRPVSPPATKDSQNRLLNDPTVRKALDSILQKFI